jgi:hypothetical protein
MRWLLQKGVIILPMTSNEEPYSEEQVDELFGFLTHSFTRIAPQYSPTKIYTSLLSQEEMKQIEEILNLHLPLLSS